MDIYEDVLKNEPSDFNSEEHTNWQKRLYKSIGWIEIGSRGDVLFERNSEGKIKLLSPIENEQVVWDVVTGDREGFECKKQIEAELLSIIVQINERLKRIEEQVKQIQTLNNKGGIEDKAD